MLDPGLEVRNRLVFDSRESFRFHWMENDRIRFFWSSGLSTMASILQRTITFTSFCCGLPEVASKGLRKGDWQWLRLFDKSVIEWVQSLLCLPFSERREDMGSFFESASELFILHGVGDLCESLKRIFFWNWNDSGLPHRPHSEGAALAIRKSRWLSPESIRISSTTYCRIFYSD